jgi:cyanophycin synthetase
MTTNHKTIKFVDIHHIKGPNMWTYGPVLEAWVDIGQLEDCPSNTIPGFAQRLEKWLPGLIEHRCSIGTRGGFLQRLHTGTWPGHILEHVTLELQSLAGLPGGFGRARETSIRGLYKVIVNAWHENVTRLALTIARDLVMAAIEDTSFDLNTAIEALKDLTDDKCLGPSTACIVEAAEKRMIPHIRLTDGNLVQLGYGAASRRIWTAETDHTSAIAETISRDKDLTKTLLSQAGLPVPEGRSVNSSQDAWGAAQDIGLPVVIKPIDANHGRGVFINLSTEEQIAKAYTVAVQEGSGVIVERFIRGNEHRLLVVGGKFIAAARGESAVVHGDGKQTILELIESQLNSDPRRGHTEDHPLNPIRIDSAAELEIQRQGFTPDSVPPKNLEVLIQRNGNVSIDATHLVHPEIAAAVELAANVVGLDIAGIDMVNEDISKPLSDTRGAIVEVNAGPGLLMHLKPAEGQAQPVGKAIVDHLFPENQDGRIPVIGVCGVDHLTATSQFIARGLRKQFNQVGLSCSQGIYLNDRPIEQTNSAHWEGGRRILLNRSVQAAVIENKHNQIVTEGLAYDRCQVGIVTNAPTSALIPERYIEDEDKLFTVIRTQVDVILKTGCAILNADDKLVLDMHDLCDGEVIFFSQNKQNPDIQNHINKGKRALILSNNQIEFFNDSKTSIKIELKENTQTPIACLAAAGALWFMGISHQDIAYTINATI